MVLVAQRLREAGRATVPSDAVVAMAKFVSEPPAAAERDELARTPGARVFHRPDGVRRAHRCE